MSDIVERLRSHGNLDVALCNEAADEIKSLRQRITELEACIKSHGIPVKSMSGGVAHYRTGEEK